LREYLDILAVAVMVAFGVRALFLQPFKIPTSSMQPTLFGIHYAEKSAFPKFPDFLSLAFFGARNAELTVKADGYINPNSFNSFAEYLFFKSSEFQLGGINYQLPGKILQTADNGEFDIKYYPLSLGVKYREGEKPVRGWMVTGDHLFVDRFSHHFKPLKRGDVLVFNTEKISENGYHMRGFYYIKRLIALPGDKIRIQDNTVYITPENKLKETEIYKLSEPIKKIYSGKGGYHGHQNAGAISEKNSLITVPEDMYFVLGDNSERSYDSRYWGFVPRESVVGRGFFIFWPFSRRWGIVDSKEPLDIPTNFRNIKETMNKQ
jgi:signal peptidase I